MNTIKIYNGKLDERQARQIAAWIDGGAVVIMPTDTAYAITGDALNVKTVEKISRMKGINPEKTTLSIICSDISMASEYARIGDAGFNLLKRLTPGPLTVLFRTASKLPKAFKGRKTVGIRIPDCEPPRMVAEALGRPLITATIDYNDEDYARNPDLIAEAYEGKADMMIDAGDGSTSQSTVVDCSDDSPVLIREGLVSEKEIFND